MLTSRIVAQISILFCSLLESLLRFQFVFNPSPVQDWLSDRKKSKNKHCPHRFEKNEFMILHGCWDILVQNKSNRSLIRIETLVKVTVFKYPICFNNINFKSCEHICQGSNLETSNISIACQSSAIGQEYRTNICYFCPIAKNWQGIQTNSRMLMRVRK